METELIQQQLFEQEQSVNYEFVHETMSLVRKDYQTVLILLDFYDFKVLEFDYLLDKPMNMIKMYLHRGGIQLKKQLEQRMNKPRSDTYAKGTTSEISVKLCVNS